MGKFFRIQIGADRFQMLLDPERINQGRDQQRDVRLEFLQIK